jgi:hypothetical protein
MKNQYQTFICEHCNARVKRSKPLTHQHSMPCPKCRKQSSYYVDHEGNEHPRPPQKPIEEIMEDLAKLGVLKNPDEYGHWEWKSKKNK